MFIRIFALLALVATVASAQNARPAVAATEPPAATAPSAPAATAPARAAPQRAVTLDRVIAVVNDEAITQYELDDARSVVLKQLKQQKVQLPDAERHPTVSRASRLRSPT